MVVLAVFWFVNLHYSFKNAVKGERHPELGSPKESPKGIPSGLWTGSIKIPKSRKHFEDRRVRNDKRIDRFGIENPVNFWSEAPKS